MQVHLPAAHLQKKSEAEKTLRDMALWHWGDKRSEWALFQFQQQRRIMMTHAVSFSSNGYKHRESHSKCCMKIWRLWTTQIHRGCTIWSTYISLELRPASLSIDPRCACRPRCLDKWPCWDVDVWRSCGRLLYPVPSISIRQTLLLPVSLVGMQALQVRCGRFRKSRARLLRDWECTVLRCIEVLLVFASSIKKDPWWSLWNSRGDYKFQSSDLVV